VDTVVVGGEGLDVGVAHLGPQLDEQALLLTARVLVQPRPEVDCGPDEQLMVRRLGSLAQLVEDRCQLVVVGRQRGDLRFGAAVAVVAHRSADGREPRTGGPGPKVPSW